MHSIASAPVDRPQTGVFRSVVPKGMVRYGLRCSILDAVWVGMFCAATEAWLVPLLQIGLGAPAATIGILATAPQIAGIVIGPWMKPVVAAMGGVKRCTVFWATAQSLCTLLVLLPLLDPTASWAIPVGLMAGAGIGICGVIAGGAWMSWMGDLVPRTVRGRYNTKRARLFHLARLGSAVAFAGLMWLLPAQTSLWGVGSVLLFAAIGRGIGTWYLYQQTMPPARPGAIARKSARTISPSTGLLGFLHDLPRTDFGRWTLVWASLQAGVFMAGPFFVPYMISEAGKGGLGLSASIWYSLLIYVAVLTRLAIYPVVGRFIDQHGAAASLRVAAIGILFIPIPWVLTDNLWILLATEVASGMFWCLGESAAGVLIFSAHPDPDRRTQLVGYFQSTMGIAIASGAFLGGLYLATPVLPAVFGSDFRTLFLISTIARIPAALIAWRMLPGLRTDRPGDQAQIWHLIPGVDLATQMGRGMTLWWKRLDDE